MKKLLSHKKTKMELTDYIARKALDHAEIIGKRLVAAWGTACEATHKNVAHLRSTHVMYLKTQEQSQTSNFVVLYLSIGAFIAS